MHAQTQAYNHTAVTPCCVLSSANFDSVNGNCFYLDCSFLLTVLKAWNKQNDYISHSGLLFIWIKQFPEHSRVPCHDTVWYIASSLDQGRFERWPGRPPHQRSSPPPIWMPINSLSDRRFLHQHHSSSDDSSSASSSHLMNFCSWF